MKPDQEPGDSNPRLFPIVGIGASAGGLNALECFFGALPRDFNFAVVFVQHLSTRHKSLLPGLLRNRRSDIEVNEIADGMEIRPGKIYLSPPGREVDIVKGVFSVSSSPKEHFHLPIDEFLASLAEEAGERALAVIFSGAGTDGARGIQAVRNGGGTVFVQDPVTAEFPAMPVAAIATGRVDGVLPPDDIAREIVKLTGAVPSQGDKDITPAQFESFFRLISEKTGYKFNHYKESVVGRRIKRRMYLRGVATVQDYLKVIGENDSEASSMVSDLMIGVTQFFRDRLAWKALKIEVIRKLAAADIDQPVRVWTPACATGEEAYSIAIMLDHEFSLAGRKREIQVFATDVNERALERARNGMYPGSIAADVLPDYMRKYFTSVEDGLSVVISKEIRERVVFAKQDILTDPPFSRLDLIICRNLLIYLEPDAQEKCIALFHYALKEGGYLFLGNAESPGKKSALFKSLAHKKCRIYQKIETKEPTRLSLSVPFASERTPTASRVMAEQQPSVTEFIQQALLEESGPPAVAVDQHYDIVYNNGPTNRYLRQPRGAPTQNLLELLPENLRSRIRGALYRATQESRPVSIRAVIPDDAEKPPEADSSKKRGRKKASPSPKERKKDLKTGRQVILRISKVRENLFLVVFMEKGGLSRDTEAVQLESSAVDENAVRQLESELSATRADLQSHIEQLKSLNEELQSSNEELQAANEELETSREELQSLNEELITVNSQLQSKIEEQEETNNDLNNFLSSTNIPTIFLDNQFRVKRFTPAMSRLLKLIPSDVGRPIADMSQENLGPDLIPDALAVLDSLVPIKKEISMIGSSYIRAVLPYRTADSRIEGVVVTYNDVSDLKRAEERTKHLASFPQMNPNPVCEADTSGNITFCNPATEKVLEDLGMDKRDFSVFLPADFDDILREWDGTSEASVYRELTVRDRIFGASIYLNPQFNVARIYAFEITARRLAEEKTMRAKEQWERTFASVPDMIAIIDNDHKIVRVNESMAKRLGKKPEECIGMKCYEAVHGTGGPIDTCPHYQTLKDGCEHIQEVREEHLGMDLLVTTTPLRDGKGRMVGSVHVAHDITGRKRAEEEIRRRVEELRLANEELTRFNQASVGRELRMIELKKEVNEFCKKAGLPERYKLDFEEEA